MKKFLFSVISAVLALCWLSACVKDDLENVDVKVDGSLKTTFSTGSRASGASSSGRVGIGF